MWASITRYIARYALALASKVIGATPEPYGLVDPVRKTAIPDNTTPVIFSIGRKALRWQFAAEQKNESEKRLWECVSTTTFMVGCSTKRRRFGISAIARLTGAIWLRNSKQCRASIEPNSEAICKTCYLIFLNGRISRAIALTVGKQP